MFTFNNEIEVNEELVEKTKNLFEEEILVEYEYEEVCVEFLQEYIADLSMCKSCNPYPYNGSKRESAIAMFPHCHGNDELGKIFGFKKISDKWENEGAEDYYSYTFIDRKTEEDKLTKGLKKIIQDLRNLGNSISIEINGQKI